MFRSSTPRFAPSVGAAALAAALLSSTTLADVVTVPASAWLNLPTNGTGATASVGAYSASLTTLTPGSWATASPYGGPFSGVWIGGSSSSSSSLQLSFGGQWVTSVSMYFTAVSGNAAGSPETFLQWSVLSGTVDSVSVTDTVEMDVTGSGSLSTLVVSATPSASDGRFRVTLTSTSGFSGLQFRHDQYPLQNGSVLNGLTFETAAVPGPGAVALLTVGGLVGRGRRRR